MQSTQELVDVSLDSGTSSADLQWSAESSLNGTNDFSVDGRIGELPTAENELEFDLSTPDLGSDF